MRKRGCWCWAVSPKKMTMRTLMKVVDLFCGAGGAAVGLHRAGFSPYGIDNKPQPHYPFPFLMMDAIEAMDRLLRSEGLVFSHGETVSIADFAFYWASPPCQGYIHLKNGEDLNGYPLLIDDVRAKFTVTNKPFCIENVPAAKDYLLDPLMLCGTMFGLPIWKHRYFEIKPTFYPMLNTCNHKRGRIETPLGTIDIPVYVSHGGDGALGPRPSRIGIRHRPSQSRELKMYAMGLEGLSWPNQSINEAIPPAFSEYIGRQSFHAA